MGKYIVATLFVIAFALYLMARSCDGQGPEAGILGLFYMFGSFVLAIVGLIGTAFLVGQFTARRSRDRDT